MSQYTYVNIFSEHTKTIKQRCRLGVTLRNSERVQNCLVARVGGWNNNTDEMLSNNDSWLVYDVPIHSSAEIEQGDKVATVLIDKFEDTSSTHRTYLYEVYAYDSVDKVAEKKIADDRVGEKTELYYEENYGLTVRVHY
jgi:hypothetical protein